MVQFTCAWFELRPTGWRLRNRHGNREPICKWGAQSGRCQWPSAETPATIQPKMENLNHVIIDRGVIAGCNFHLIGIRCLIRICFFVFLEAKNEAVIRQHVVNNNRPLFVDTLDLFVIQLEPNGLFFLIHLRERCAQGEDGSREAESGLGRSLAMGGGRGPGPIWTRDWKWQCAD